MNRRWNLRFSYSPEPAHRQTASQVRQRIDAKLIVEMEKVFKEIYPNSWRQNFANFKTRMEKHGQHGE